MYRTTLTFLLCCLILFSLQAQVRLNVEGNARITGRLELWPTAADTTSLVLGKGAGLLADFSEERSNTFLGNGAGRINTSGYHNTFLGTRSGDSNTSGFGNTFLGSLSGNTNTEGRDNVFTGFLAGFSNTLGSFNTMLGTIAGFSNTSGEGNIFLGYGAGYNNTTGSLNVAIGKDALRENTDRTGLVAVGDSSLYHNGLGADETEHGELNTAVGTKTLFFNTFGSKNTATGARALYSNTEGYFNAATGINALYSNTEGSRNTATGAASLYSNTIGNSNTATGYLALRNNQEGHHNTATGVHALYANRGSRNTTTGGFALYYNTDGYDNTAMGYFSLYNNSTGFYNTALGNASNVSTGDLSYAMALGGQAISNSSEKTVIAHNGPGVIIGGYANWSNLSDGRFKEDVQENVPGIEFIRRLRPVTYWVNLDKLQRHITAQMPDTIAQRYLPDAEAMAGAQREIRTGFVAQEVEAAAKRIGYAFDGVNAPKNPTDNYSIAYGQFVPSLVKAAKEQEDKIESLKRRVDELEELVRHLLDHDPEAETTQTQSIQLRKEPQLLQNRPNPFSSETIIAYYVPEGITKAQLRISVPDGKVLRLINISSRGAGQTILQTQDLPAGVYAYTLILDGEIADSRQMVLQR